MPERPFRVCACVTLAFLGASLSTFAPPGEAAQQRSFVASNGSDASPCQLTTPCRTFTAAIAQTLEGGEVIVLDSAGYGPVTITSSVTIAAPPGVYAGISVFSGDGVSINAGLSDRIVLRGLNIVGIGGTAGVRFITGASVHVVDCNITGMQVGIAFQPSATATLYVSDSRIVGGNHGIEVGAASGTAYANIERVQVQEAGAGIYGSDRSKIQIVDTLSTRNFNNYQLQVTGPAMTAEMNITRSVSSFSGNAGIRTSGSSLIVVRVSDSTIVDENNNAIGDFDGSSVLTRNNNTMEGGSSGQAFTGVFNAK